MYLRRSIAFMVTKGFSLLDIRKLYIDELSDFYNQLVFILEKKGEMKPGTYGRIEGVDTVNSLRTQLFRVNQPHK